MTQRGSLASVSQSVSWAVDFSRSAGSDRSDAVSSKHFYREFEG